MIFENVIAKPKKEKQTYRRQNWDPSKTVDDGLLWDQFVQ